MSDQHIERPKRWDVPYSREQSAGDTFDVTDDDVERLLASPPFSEIDQSKFSSKMPLQGILKNDARLLDCQQGDIIIRKGDWGNSAFFLLSGSVRVDVGDADGTLPEEVLGRKTVRQKGILESVAQLWHRPRDSEVRQFATYKSDSRINTRGDGSASRIYLQDVPAVLQQYQTVRLKAVQLFGEQSALGRIERSATVFAEGNCELLEIRWQGLRDILRRDAKLRETVDELFRKVGLSTFLRGSRYFSHLLPPQNTRVWVWQPWNRLIQQAEFASYGTYDKVEKFMKLAEYGTSVGLKNETIIAEEGEYPNGVIFIRSGLVRVSQKHHNGHRTLGYLTPGQAFGVEEVAQGWSTGAAVGLKYSLRAIGYVTIVRVSTALFEKLVLGNETLAEELTRPQVSDDTFQKHEIDSGLLEFLTDRRIVNGTQSMVIDLDRCTRCDDCVRACAATHDNNPRFVRNGPVHGNYMVANACMHCMDPVCMIECPTGAIHRNLAAGEIVINDQTCIGCSVCANNCPYDAIRIVPVHNPSGGLFERFAQLWRGNAAAVDPKLSIKDRGQVPGDLIRDSNHMPLEKATKCDLCAEQLTGPACQNACPHDALVRLDMRKMESVADWLNR